MTEQSRQSQLPEKMGIYIIEDDETMIEILSDLIETHELGIVIGSTEGKRRSSRRFSIWSRI